MYGDEEIDEEDRQFGLLMRWRELGYSDSGKSGWDFYVANLMQKDNLIASQYVS